MEHGTEELEKKLSITGLKDRIEKLV